MATPAAPKPYNFDTRLMEASVLLGIPPDELVSIKIRPIQAVGGVDNDLLNPTLDYAYIDGKLAAFTGKKPVMPVPHDKPELCELKQGHVPLVYVRHESGPEIIIAITLIAKAIGAGAVAGIAVIKFINELNRAIGTAPTKKGKKVPTSIESRMKKGEKVLKQIADMARAAEDAISNVTELTKALF
jgi:hypothetical protein